MSRRYTRPGHRWYRTAEVGPPAPEYIAAFLDFDGSVGRTGRKKPGPRRDIWLVNSDRGVLEDVREIFDGGIYGKRSPNDLYRLHIKRAEFERFVELVGPFSRSGKLDGTYYRD